MFPYYYRISFSFKPMNVFSSFSVPNENNRIGKHFNFKLHQQNYLDAQIVIVKLIPVENKECIAANYKGLC